MARYPKLSQTLKKLLYERDMKPIDLARKVDMPQPTIHRLVTGKSSRPYKSSLEPIADYFDISVEQLLGIEELEQSNNKQPPAKQTTNNLPLIPWEMLYDIESSKKTAKQSVIASHMISQQAFATTMPNSSMEPLFQQGATLIFDPSTQPSDRSYVLAKIGDNNVVTFRQILIDADYQYLKPLNPDLNQFQMRLLSTNDKILGCLVESRNVFLSNNNTLQKSGAK